MTIDIFFSIKEFNKGQTFYTDFEYFKPKQTTIGWHYDVEKMFYPLCRHSLKGQYGVLNGSFLAI